MGPVSGHFEGLRVWLLQRVSAIYLGLFLTYVLARFFLNPRPDYVAWRTWFAHPLFVICSAGFVIALLLHAWVGLRDVVLDYVRHLGARMVLLTLIIFLLTGCGLWAIRILILAGGGM
jgi:succinate dehydrogenase / fumarate reductase membrane anchor subunit